MAARDSGPGGAARTPHRSGRARGRRQEETVMTDLSNLRLGTAPDSWGVWFASDPHQVTWDVYLDEIARVGYVYTELGPQGYMPQDPHQLNDELARRGLTVCGGTVFAGLHKGADALDQAKADFGREAK